MAENCCPNGKKKNKCHKQSHSNYIIISYKTQEISARCHQIQWTHDGIHPNHLVTIHI